MIESSKFPVLNSYRRREGQNSKLPHFDVCRYFTYTVECGVVDFVGEVECPSDVVVVSVGFPEVVGLGFSVVVLKVLKHTKVKIF